MTAAIRHVDVDPGAPLETWPYEALVALVERGTVGDWARLAVEVAGDPWGPVARQLEDYLSYERPYGVGPLLARSIDRARQHAVQRERAAVADEVGELVRRSGLTTSDLASRLGTSRPRLSTYRSGAVTPSAAFLVRLRALVARREASRD
jgi:DNA-binding transcriptional regulator YiaG